MLSSLSALIFAAGVVAPQPTQVVLNPTTGAPRLETGILSAPLTGELTPAVRDWALSQRQHLKLPSAATLKSTEAFSTRFGASFHLQQTVKDIDVYEAKLVVTLDEQRRVVQVASSLSAFTQVLEGAPLTVEQALERAATTIPLVALRPDGVPYGGGKAFYFPVGAELHRGFVVNVHSLDMMKNWYVGVDAVTGERIFVQNRVHHAALDAKVYPISPGGLDAGVGAVPTVTRELRHGDGRSMVGDTCVSQQLDGGSTSYANDAGELCGTQLMMYNCCPTENCQPDAGMRRMSGSVNYMGVPVRYNVGVCDRVRRASNVTNGTADYSYTPVDPPSDFNAVLASDLANSDEFAEVHAFYHVNTVYDWMRDLSSKGPAIFGNDLNIQPFRMRDERRMPPVKVAVWTNVMFPNFRELIANPGCVLSPQGCQTNTLLRVDNAAFFPRENFAQIPLPGFDTGADALLIFQGNAADAAYDATVIQHEFGHGAVYATAALSFTDTAIDARSANNEGGALHEGFADYIAAAFNNEPNVGPYFGPRATAGQGAPGVPTDGYLRSMTNTHSCPSVLWGEVHQDSMHVSGALWAGRQAFLGADNGGTYDAAFYAMLVSISPNADFAMVASAMSARVATAFPATATASAQMTQIFKDRGVIDCSKVLSADSTTLPRRTYNIAAATGALSTSLIPGPLQFKLAAPAGATSIRVTAVDGQGNSPVRLLVKRDSPITFANQGNSLQNDAEQTVNMVSSGNNLTGTAQVNAPCGSDVYVTLGIVGTGASLGNVNVTLEPLMNCMIPTPDGGSGDGGSGTVDVDAGSPDEVMRVASVGDGNVTRQSAAKTGCGCSSPADIVAPLMALVTMLGVRRRRS